MVITLTIDFSRYTHDGGSCRRSYHYLGVSTKIVFIYVPCCYGNIPSLIAMRRLGWWANHIVVHFDVGVMILPDHDGIRSIHYQRTLYV